MACTHCPQHCPPRDVTEALRLDGPPSSAPVEGVNLRFYREFAMAYSAARTARLRPRQALTAANPWMSATQCSAYLKRARELGFIATPARVDAGRRRGSVPAPAGDGRVAGRTTDPDGEEEAPRRPVASSRRPRRGNGSRVVDGEEVQALLAHYSIIPMLWNAALMGHAVTTTTVRGKTGCTEPMARAVLLRLAANGMGELDDGALVVPLRVAPENLHHQAGPNAIR